MEKTQTQALVSVSSHTASLSDTVPYLFDEEGGKTKIASMTSFISLMAVFSVFT